ncbi:DUF421 domain-containing protein [Niallia endozanthoxylica]|uniref:DUF421 domain-containing protein n=1 Tax=Niallia endozanthoxylica TaxID=2036016 RepID=A0A5J5HXF7_9BACI|nr:DUF421 domain-containing protein [Niallia endozanthoxylica]KAA9026423.1 DUF421 domain-containing protein [Niallia endozanthoxylica]
MDEMFTVILRTILTYFIILLIFRFMGKREIGELSVFDLVVNIMIAEIAVMAIDETSIELMKSIVPIIMLMLIQITMARLSLKSKKFRDLVDGSPSIVINQGQIDENVMRKQRYNFDDLLQQLREKNVRNIADVEFAILEPSGKLSVFEKEKNNEEGDITLPLIVDGVIQYDHLHIINKTELWLRQQLKQKGYLDIKKISFCSYQNNQFYIDLIEE